MNLFSEKCFAERDRGKASLLWLVIHASEVIIQGLFPGVGNSVASMH